MIVTQEHDVDWRQRIELDSRSAMPAHAYFAFESDALRPHRIGENVEAVELQQYRRVIHHGDAQLPVADTRRRRRLPYRTTVRPSTTMPRQLPTRELGGRLFLERLFVEEAMTVKVIAARTTIAGEGRHRARRQRPQSDRERNATTPHETSNTIFPTVAFDSSRACASRTLAIGYSRSIVARITPRAYSGTTCVSNARVARIFSSSGRFRSTVPRIVSRDDSTRPSGIVASAPAIVPMRLRRPRGASAARLAATYAPPTRSSTMFTPLPPLQSLARAASCPRSPLASQPSSSPYSRARSSFPAPRAVPNGTPP